MFVTLTFLLTFSLGVAKARIGFVKDQSMTAPFPGPVYRQSPSLPEGHMRPLGWQRRADGPITEDSEMPASQEFYENYVSKDKPVVFRDAINQAPAFQSWQDDKYLTEKYGQLNVTVIVHKRRHRGKLETSKQVMKFKKFLYEYMYESWYLASIIPRDMMDELPLPKCVRCGTISERYISAQLWMSSGGTSSKLHSHDNHLLHCVIMGRRDFIVIENWNKKYFDYSDDYPGSLGGHSDIDTERINAFTYKNVARVPWTWSILYPGDCLFVPAGYLHQVRSHGKSVSITVEFATLSNFDNTDCTLIEEEFVPLSEAFYLLAFEDGVVRLAETDLDVDELKRILHIVMGKNNILNAGKFENFYKEVFADFPNLPPAQEVFELLRSEEQETQITLIDLLEMKPERLQKVVDVFNNAYAGVTHKERENIYKNEERGDIHTEWHSEF